MKRKLWIVLALAVLAAGLWCGTALASAGLGFVTQPTIGPMDTEELTIPVTWEPTFTPTEIKIAYYDTSLDEFIETVRKVTAQKDGSYLFSTRDIGYTYRIHAYYTQYDYLTSTSFEIPQDPALAFTVQPVLGAMDTEDLTFPATWQTGFLPTQIKIAYYDTSLDEFIETVRKVTAQKDGSYLFSTRDIGYTYRIHAYYTSYNYLASDPFPLKFIDVSFEPGGALGSTNTLRVLSGVPFTLPDCTFTWAHHVFNGWAIGDILYQPGDTVTLTEDTAIPAAWKKTYTITFSPGSGSGASGTMEPLEVPVNEEFTLPACTFTPPEGKIFSRWGASGDL